MKSTSTQLAFLVAAGLAAAAPASASLLINQNFTDLTGWTDTTVTNWSVGTNLTYTGFTSTGGSAFENTANTGQFLENTAILGANTITDGTTYWGAFLVQTTVANTAARTFGFYQGTGSRLTFTINADNSLSVGTRDASGDGALGNVTTGTSVGLGTNTTNLVLFRIDAKVGNDDLYVWYNPTLATFDSSSIAGTAFTSIGLDNFATTTNMATFRFSSSNTGRTAFDELRLGTAYSDIVAVPEPSAFAALAGLGALGFVGSRRRRA